MCQWQRLPQVLWHLSRLFPLHSKRLSKRSPSSPTLSCARTFTLHCPRGRVVLPPPHPTVQFSPSRFVHCSDQWVENDLWCNYPWSLPLDLSHLDWRSVHVKTWLISSCALFPCLFSKLHPVTLTCHFRIDRIDVLWNDQAVLTSFGACSRRGRWVLAPSGRCALLGALLVTLTPKIPSFCTVRYCYF